MDDLRIEEAKQFIDLLGYIEHATHSTTKRRSRYCVINPCPFCGKKDHFVVKPDEQYYKTFAECGRSGTIIDFLMQYEGLSMNEAIKKTLHLAGMDSQSYDPQFSKQNSTLHVAGIATLQTESISIQGLYDFTEFVEETHASVEQTQYFKDRGLTEITIQKYKLGFAENGLNQVQKYYNVFKIHPTFLALYKFTLPVWDADGKCRYFVPRLDDSSVPSHYTEMPSKTLNLPGLRVSIFNSRYLEISQSSIMFITEGIFDALSIEEFQYPCLALNGTSNANKFFELISNRLDRDTSFVLVPDNDEAGEKLKQKFQQKLDELGIPFFVMNLPEMYKDANEYLIKDREGLEKMVNQTVKQIENANKHTQTDNIAGYLGMFLQEVTENALRPISTGFEKMDVQLSGGLIPGLYVVGAISSLGKTTFIHQMADAIAGQRIPVLFFSLEMSKKEMVSKSLSRQMYLMDSNNAYSAIDIMKGNVPREILTATIQAYSNTAEYLTIEEGSINTDVVNIREQVQIFREQHHHFVVFVDYLQIIQCPFERYMGEKQAVEHNVSQLKLISRDFEVPVIVVSSFNRNNYNQTAGFESYKESGTIEYSADVVMALQLKNMGLVAQQKDETKRRDLIHETKAKLIRPLELIILKQRNGQSFAKVDFAYHTMFNHFQIV